MARKKTPSIRERFDAWSSENPKLTLILVAASVAAALIAILLFVLFTDFSGSAEFIYNQF